MKLKNTTDYPDHLLRRMVRWCAKEIDPGWHIGRIDEIDYRYTRCAIPVRVQKAWMAKYGTPATLTYPLITGVAQYRRRRLRVSIAPPKHWRPTTLNHRRVDLPQTAIDRDTALVQVTAHELAHHYQYEKELRGAKCSGVNGKMGGSEDRTDRIAWRVTAAFLVKRESLWAEWSREPEQVAAFVAPRKSRKEQNHERAAMHLAAWEKKLKRAETAVKKYRAVLRRYEREAGKLTA